MESTEKINILVLILPISTKPYRALSIELYYSLYDFLTNSYFNTCSTLRKQVTESYILFQNGFHFVKSRKSLSYFFQGCSAP